jgi:hypothetical protein
VIGAEEPAEAYNPLSDETIPIEKRSFIFGRYVSSYFTHPNPFSHRPGDLNYKHPDLDKKPSIERMSELERSAIMDLTAGERGDNLIGIRIRQSFRHVLVDIIRMALLDENVRQAWRNASFCCMWGQSNTWFIPIAVWAMEDMIRDANRPDIKVHWKVTDGNHMVSNFSLSFSDD